MGAVRDPEVVEALLSECGAQHVEVARRIGRGHVIEESLDRSRAFHERARTLERSDLGWFIGGAIDLDQRIELRVIGAVDRRRLAHAARIEADDVEGLPDRIRDDRTRRAGVFDPARAGATGIDDQRSACVARCGAAQYGDLQRRTCRIGVVHGNLERGALEAIAVGPGELLVVEAGQIRRGRRGSGRRRRGRCLGGGAPGQ